MSDKIPRIIERTITDSNLQNTTFAIAEVALDSLLDPGFLKDIPLLGSVLGLGKAAFSIRDRLFIKKLCSFFTELDGIPEDERKEMIKKINESEESESFVGEKLLYIVDRCEDSQASTDIGRLFRHFLEQRISFDEFRTYSSIVINLTHSDLIEFVQCDWEEWDAGDVGQYQTYGLVVLDSPSVTVRDQDDWKSSEPYIIESREPIFRITSRGKKIRELLG